MNARGPHSTKLWFTFDGSLEALAARLREGGVIGEADLDFENVYEWFTAPLLRDDRIDLNISREHDDGEAAPEEPVDLLLMVEEAPHEAQIDALAQQIATLLGADVLVGQVEYLGGDDYRREEKRRFEPGA